MLFGLSWASGEASAYEDDGYTAFFLPRFPPYGLAKGLGVDEKHQGSALRMITMAANPFGQGRNVWHIIENIHLFGRAHGRDDWDDEGEEGEEGEDKEPKEEPTLAKGGGALVDYPNLKHATNTPHPSICVPAIKHPSPSLAQGLRVDLGASPRRILEKTLDLLAHGGSNTKRKRSLPRRDISQINKALAGWQAKVRQQVEDLEPSYSDDEEEED